MPDPAEVLSLPPAPPERMLSAVHEAIAELPWGGVLQTGAAETVAAQESAAAVAFQSLIELGYLAASADGLADAERDTLAVLFEQATGRAVDRDTLLTHFKDLDAATEILGRRERLGRVAANLVGAATGDDVIGFVTLIAMSDGTLAQPERAILNELGEHFRMSEKQVRALIDKTAAHVGEKLR